MGVCQRDDIKMADKSVNYGLYFSLDKMG
ncbi:hypothetical protein XNC3_110020 [Xenorhabdus nematophila F1]|nr:hypothetical protein XNC3_110020 [Xenorhabdus nematophila F1]